MQKELLSTFVPLNSDDEDEDDERRHEKSDARE